MEQVLRVLVVDDSAYIRKVLKQMLSRNTAIEVVGTARDGSEALALVEQLKPDVVTTDVMMPEMDGIAFVREQMARRPVPIVVVSIASESGEQVMAALEAGAVDVIQKPTALATEKVFEMADELVAKVRAAARVPLASSARAAPEQLAQVPPTVASAPAGPLELIVIGISTGGPQALKHIVPRLPANFPVPLAIVLHMPVGYTEMYARSLDMVSPLAVVEARENMAVKPGVVLLAPAGQHLVFRRALDGTVVTQLTTQPSDTPHRPSVDVLFQSAAELYHDRVLGVVMTGMGTDGRNGAAWIKAQGGSVWTEAEATCVVYGMPRAVAEAGLSDRSIALTDIAAALQEIC